MVYIQTPKNIKLKIKLKKKFTLISLGKKKIPKN